MTVNARILQFTVAHSSQVEGVSPSTSESVPHRAALWLKSRRFKVVKGERSLWVSEVNVCALFPVINSAWDWSVYESLVTFHPQSASGPARPQTQTPNVQEGAGLKPDGLKQHLLWREIWKSSCTLYLRCKNRRWVKWKALIAPARPVRPEEPVSIKEHFQTADIRNIHFIYDFKNTQCNKRILSMKLRC